MARKFSKYSLKGNMREYFRKPHVPRKLKKELKKVTVVRTGYPFDDVRMVEREDGSIIFEGKISARVEYKPGVKVNRWTRRARSKVYVSVVKAMKHLMQDVGYKFIKRNNQNV